jgi:shikimate dehydrogenase
MQGYYHLFELPNTLRANEFVQEMSSTSLLGMNITFPYKQSVIEVADHIDKSVKKVGSANVIKYQEEDIFVYNTDITGFAKFLHNHDLHLYKSALIVGAGSAGQTVGKALLDEGMNVTFVNRSKKRYNSFTEYLKQSTSQRTIDEFDSSLPFDLYVNATTIGHDGNLVTDFVEFNDEVKSVIDLNYSNKGTPLVNSAQIRGKRAFDGKEMLFHQAVDAYEIWTNYKVDRLIAYNEFINMFE